MSSLSTSVPISDATVHAHLGVDQAVGSYQFGSVYTGTVVGSNAAKQSYDVHVDRPSGILYNVMNAIGPFTALLGIQSSRSLTVGTRVAVVQAAPPFIISTLPSCDPDLSGGEGRTATQEEVPKPESDPEDTYDNYSGPNIPNDFLPGEFEIGNQIGVVMQFMTTFLKMSAGDRAKVEAHLTDGMVRIVSDMFKNYTAFGDVEILNAGGGPTVFEKGTSKTHEAWGCEAPGDPKAEVDKDIIAPDAVAETGRWRMSSYMGYLGDFIHWILHEPEDAIGNYAQACAGKFAVHVNNDGGFVMQSVSEISVEVVKRILVPVEKKRPDDPEGNTRKEIEEAVQQGGLNLDNLLKRWDYHEDRMHYLPYVLRHYARYLSQLHSYARILSQDKDYELPSEATAPAPSWNNKEEDVLRANSGEMDTFEVYACIRILRDGSILNMDHYGNAFLMTKRGIQASSILDYSVEAARDISFTAGRSIYVMARRNLEISAIVGGIKMKARTLFHALCERGSMWFKSDAPDLKDPEFESKRYKDGDKEFESDPDAEVLDAAIFLDAELGNILSQAGRGTMILSTGEHLTSSEESDESSVAGSVVLSSAKQDVVMFGDRDATIVANGEGDFGKVSLKAKESLSLVGKKFLVRASEVVDFNQQLTLRKGTLHTRNITALDGKFTQGLAGPKVGVDPPESKVPVHYNHVKDQADSALEDPETGRPGETEASSELRKKSFRHFKMFQGRLPSWDYYPKSEYLPDLGEGDEALPWRTLSQERLEDDPTIEGYEDWDWSGNKLSSAGDRLGRKYSQPWYGESPKIRVTDNTEPLLGELSSTKPSEMNEVPKVSTSDKKFKFKP